MHEVVESQRRELDFDQGHREQVRKRLEALIPEFLALRSAFIEDHLHNVGLSTMERSARWELVPEGIKKKLPAGLIECPLKQGFGLIGTTGIGKSFALAAWLRIRCEAFVDRAMSSMIRLAPEQLNTWPIENSIRNKSLQQGELYQWVSWHGEITNQRARLFAKEQCQVEEWVQTLLAETTLVLDDIGSEHETGSDWAGETLARVIDERDRWGFLTLWSSNLGLKDLVGRYGSRIVSRLFRLAPPIVLPTLPDLRLKGLL